MKYMMLIADSEDGMATSTEEEKATYGRIGEWWNEHTAAGRIIEGHELQPSSTATTVRIAPDGPRVEKSLGTCTTCLGAALWPLPPASREASSWRPPRPRQRKDVAAHLPLA